MVERVTHSSLRRAATAALAVLSSAALAPGVERVTCPVLRWRSLAASRRRIQFIVRVAEPLVVEARTAVVAPPSAAAAAAAVALGVTTSTAVAVAGARALPERVAPAAAGVDVIAEERPRRHGNPEAAATLGAAANAAAATAAGPSGATASPVAAISMSSFSRYRCSFRSIDVYVPDDAFSSADGGAPCALSQARSHSRSFDDCSRTFASSAAASAERGTRGAAAAVVRLGRRAGVGRRRAAVVVVDAAAPRASRRLGALPVRRDLALAARRVGRRGGRPGGRRVVGRRRARAAPRAPPPVAVAAVLAAPPVAAAAAVSALSSRSLVAAVGLAVAALLDLPLGHGSGVGGHCARPATVTR